MEAEKQPLMNDQSPPPASAPPPAYTPSQGQGVPQYPPQYSQPPQTGYPSQPPGYPPQGYNQQQQGQRVTVITAVPVPQREVWCSPGGRILPQPDPHRIVIGGTARYRYGMLTSTSYTYADQLPCLSSTMLVFIFLCFFIGTPASLLCSIPAWYYINRANKQANEDNDIPAARDSYRIYRVSVWGLSFWFGIVLGLGITLGILGGVGVL